jgi:hypothetical protein
VVGLDGWWIVNGSCEVDGSGFGDLPVGGGHGTLPRVLRSEQWPQPC